MSSSKDLHGLTKTIIKTVTYTHVECRVTHVTLTGRLALVLLL